MTTNTGTYTPTFSPGVRSIVYVGPPIANLAIKTTLAALLILGIMPTATAVALCAVAAWAILTISNGFAVGYRPTRPDILNTLDPYAPTRAITEP